MMNTRTMKTLVMVADGGQARLFRQEGPPARPVLSDIATLERPSAHVAGRDLPADVPGWVFDQAGRGRRGGVGRARHGTAGEYDPDAAEVERFARRLSRRLDDERRRGAFQRLVLIVEPRFLGVLRPLLSGLTQRMIAVEIPRDLVHADARGVEQALVRAWAKAALGWGPGPRPQAASHAPPAPSVDRVPVAT